LGDRPRRTVTGTTGAKGGLPENYRSLWPRPGVGRRPVERLVNDDRIFEWAAPARLYAGVVTAMSDRDDQRNHIAST